MLGVANFLLHPAAACTSRARTALNNQGNVHPITPLLSSQPREMEKGSRDSLGVGAMHGQLQCQLCNQAVE